MNRQDVLREAASLISGNRDVQYGHPADNFSAIAILWEGYAGREFSLADVVAMLALVKIARLRTSPRKADSWTDLAGYAALGAEVAHAE